MNDRELLELAAKAGGIKIIRSRLDDPMHKDMLVQNSARNFHHETGPWNPLDDDGDALRLAVKLRLELTWWKSRVTALALDHAPACGIEPFNDDAPAATRRAIVRAAAEIGSRQ